MSSLAVAPLASVTVTRQVERLGAPSEIVAPQNGFALLALLIDGVSPLTLVHAYVNGDVPPETEVPGVLEVTEPESAKPLPDPNTSLAVTLMALLPRRFDIPIAPLATWARVRTAVSPRRISALDDRPSSTLTCDIEIGPVDGSGKAYTPGGVGH
jgi:hypothetical protein